MGKKIVSRQFALDCVRDFMALGGMADLDYLICGSLRRMNEEVGDADLIVVGKFPNTGRSEKYKESGAEKTRTYNYKGLQINMWTCDFDQIGSFCLYATGSGKFNQILRRIAIDKQMKLSQYGLFDRKTNKLIARQSEKEIFNKLGFFYIPPHLRDGDNINAKLKAYKMRHKVDRSYVESLIGRVSDKKLYPNLSRNMLPIEMTIPLTLKDFLKRKS